MSERDDTLGHAAPAPTPPTHTADESEPRATSLAELPPRELEEALRSLVRDEGAGALPVLSVLAEREGGPARRLARRALYRLAQSGITPPPPQGKPVVERQPERPSRAWMSAIDGNGSRAVWVLFEGGFGGFTLCSLIINDVSGVVEAAGGPITKKRLEAELAELRASQRLPWVEFPPAAVLARVAAVLALHDARGTTPPADFARWQRLLVAPGSPGPESGERTLAPPAPTADAEVRAEPTDAAPPDPDSLFGLPEFAGWFLDPERVQVDAVALLEARSTRLIVSDQVKAERERSIVTDVVERELTREDATRWALRLVEMAAILDATGRPEAAAAARATGRALVDPAQPPAGNAFARRLVERALDVASEVVSGRLSADAVSRRPDRGPSE